MLHKLIQDLPFIWLTNLSIGSQGTWSPEITNRIQNYIYNQELSKMKFVNLSDSFLSVLNSENGQKIFVQRTSPSQIKDHCN